MQGRMERAEAIGGRGNCLFFRAHKRAHAIGEEGVFASPNGKVRGHNSPAPVWHYIHGGICT